MSSARASFARHFGSARLIGLAAAFSAVVHLCVLAALSGVLDLPRAPEQDLPMLATLVHVLPAVPSAGPAPEKAKPVPRTAARSPIAPVLISEPDVSGAPLIISGARKPRSAAAPASAEGESAAPLGNINQPADPQPAGVAAAPVAERPAAVPDEPPARRILVEYALKSSLVDGRARYLWTTDETRSRYAIEGSMEADGFFASMFAGRFDQESTGDIVAAGLRPLRFSLRRGEAPAELARFDWSARQISHQRVRGEHVQPLVDNAQDLQSFIFQFRHEFKSPLMPERVSLAITNARKLDKYEFRVSGRERLRLAIGELDTIHLVRIAQDPGDAYEVWLSPTHQHLPVKIRFMLSGRFPVDQLITRIDIEP